MGGALQARYLFKEAQLYRLSNWKVGCRAAQKKMVDAKLCEADSFKTGRVERYEKG